MSQELEDRIIYLEEVVANLKSLLSDGGYLSNVINKFKKRNGKQDL